MSDPVGWSQPEHSGWGPPPGAPTGPPGPPPSWARPGIIPLRPLRLGEIYDGAFQAVRSNPGAILGWAVVVVVVCVSVSTLAQGLFDRGFLADLESSSLASDTATSGDVREVLRQLSSSLGRSAPALVLAGLLELIGQAVLAGVVTVAVSSAVLGRRVGAGAVWQTMRPRLAPLVGLSVLISVVELVVFGVCLAPGGAVLAVGASSGQATALLGGSLLLVAGALVALAVALVLNVRWLLAPPALVLEPQPVFAALRRSWSLTRRGFWRLCGIQLLTSIGVALAAGLVTEPFTLIGAAVGGLMGGHGVATVAQLGISGIGSAIASVILWPLSAAVVALLYIDQRMRREGLDVELAAAAQPA